MTQTMKHALLGASAILATLSLPAAAAQEVGVDIGIGTTGISGNVQYKAFDMLVLRGGYNYLEHEMDDEEFDDITYETEVDFSTFGAFVDLHPFQNGFLLSGGVYQGDKDVSLVATPTTSVEIGDLTFTPDQVGSLVGSLALESTAPYVGLGWDSTLYSNSVIQFHIRAGVMQSGTPEVDLFSVGGTLSDDTLFQDELAKEIQEIEDDAEDFEYYPVINLGLSFPL